MKTNVLEDKIAIKATPSLLKILGSILNLDLKDAIKPLINAISIYSCRNQIMIIDAVVSVCPYFKDISEIFFNKLYEVIEISKKTDFKEIELIANYIFTDEDSTLDAKVEFINKYRIQIENEKHKKRKLITLGVITFICIGATTIILLKKNNNKTKLEALRIIEHTKIQKSLSYNIRKCIEIIVLKK